MNLQYRTAFPLRPRRLDNARMYKQMSADEVADTPVAQNLWRLMDSHGLNPTSLERASGVAQPTIYRILKGESQDPRTATIQPLARYFGVTVADLRADHLVVEEEITGYRVARPADVETAATMLADLHPRIRKHFIGLIKSMHLATVTESTPMLDKVLSADPDSPKYREYEKALEQDQAKRRRKKAK